MTYYKRQEGNEYNESELPALELLCEGLGYTYMEPSDACRLRKKDSEVILYDVLKEQLPELNIWMKKYPEAVDMAIEKIREENFAHFKNHTDTNEIIHAMYTELSMDNLMPLEIPFDLGNGEENQGSRANVTAKNPPKRQSQEYGHCKPCCKSDFPAVILCQHRKSGDRISEGYPRNPDGPSHAPIGLGNLERIPEICE